MAFLRLWRQEMRHFPVHNSRAVRIYRRKCAADKMHRSKTEPNFPKKAGEHGHAGPLPKGRIKKTAKVCVAALKWLKLTVMPRRRKHYG